MWFFYILILVKGALRAYSLIMIIAKGGKVDGNDTLKIRQELNLTQIEFAEIVGVYPRTVQKWESGEIKQLRISTKRKVEEVRRANVRTGD